jgi:hypothetical protein
VSTTKGEHHFYRREAGTIAKSDAHSTQQHPKRIDVKTGRGLIVLAPSKGKVIKTMTADHANQLSQVNQAFIDAVNKHNGRNTLPVPAERVVRTPADDTDPLIIGRLKFLLDKINPDCGYEDWRNALMAVFHETRGSDDGLELVDAWSSGGGSYKGTKEVTSKWRSFKLDVPNPITIGTLKRMARAAEDAEDFEAVGATVIINPKAESYNLPASNTGDAVAVADEATSEAVSAVGNVTVNPLFQYSLRGSIEEIAKTQVEQVAILGNIALQGQATVLYAAPNTGKTLITLNLIIQSIERNIINPNNLYYLNMDDSGAGIVTKGRLAEAYGFHLLADGHKGFQANIFVNLMQGMIAKNTANGVIVVLDTLKKFTDLMDKKSSSTFASLVRQFVMKGGTVIALAHTNKNPGKNGKAVYAGTTDIRDDFDCAYTVEAISNEDEQKVVEFTNIKRRGNVADTVTYRYSTAKDMLYEELLASVRLVVGEDIDDLKHAEKLKEDAPVIEAIKASINEGIILKMNLAEEAKKRASVSKNRALDVIESYTGNDTSRHLWSMTVGDRGGNNYSLLAISPDGMPSPESVQIEELEL